jgi:hypothetical protein
VPDPNRSRRPGNGGSSAEPQRKPAADQAQPTAGATPDAGRSTDARPGSLTREQIAARAYEIYLARGGEHGRAEEDWLQAERELRVTDPALSIPTPTSGTRR